MQASPVALVLVPLIVVALLRRKWTIAFLVGSAPFFSLSVFTAIGHRFTLAELVLIGLLLRQFVKWTIDGSISLSNIDVFWWLVAFFIVGFFSAVYASVHPANVLVHPYNEGSFLGFEFIPLEASSNNISQSLLRLFFVLGVFSIAENINNRREIRQIVRGLAIGGILVGTIGAIYQLSIIFQFVFPTVMQWIGFNTFPVQPPHVGILPRMYSVTGEPGFTSSYLLFSLTLVATPMLFSNKNCLFTRRESTLGAILLTIFLLLSTGTTGYGGLIIFGALLCGNFIILNQLHTQKFKLVLINVGMAILLVFGIDFLFLNGRFQGMIMYQLNKIAFQAGSGTLRMKYIVRTINIVQVRPLVGVGFGSHRAPSLLFTILGETGLVGLSTFVGFHVSLYRQCGWFAFFDKTSTDMLPLTIFTAGVTLLLTSLIAKSTSTLLFPWYWFSLALPIVLIRVQRTDSEKDK